MPIPTTMGAATFGAHIGLGQHTGQLAPIDQEVVGPLDARGHAAERGAGVGRSQGDDGTGQVARSNGRRGRKSTDTNRFAAGGASQRLPNRPRPALW